MKCISINTGFLSIPVVDLFAFNTGNSAENRYPNDGINRVACFVRSLLLISGSGNVLIDTGVGTLMDQKVLKHYDYRSKGDWVTLLKPHGLTPEDITDVILTHLHFDHCGGAVRSAPDLGSREEVVLTFPNAIHWISRVQWEWAQNITEREPDSFFEHTFLSIGKHNRLNLVEKESEIIPGIKVRLFNGHTRGLIIPIITLENETIVFAGDLIPTHIHLHPEIGMSYDLDPELVREEKEGFLAEIKSHNWKLMFQHELALK
jgi:glyoxylase-like metal-dependent hydrolase (beta-lactamase superfamily II)